MNELLLTEDSSAEQHRNANLAWLDAAGLDTQFAEALYELDFDSRSHPFADDVPEVLHAFKARELKIAIVSNIHIDLRPEFRDAGFDELVDAYVLSFEQGVCKPDAAIFDRALETVGASRVDALMVGDRSQWDGGAVAIRIPTLLVPTLRQPESRRLDLAIALVDASLGF